MTAVSEIPPAHPFLEGPIASRLARLAMPGLLGGLMQSVLYVADGWFIGSLGPVALAGVALVFPLFALSVMLSAGAMGGAVVAATARALGARDKARAGALVRTALMLALFGGGGSALLVVFFGAEFFRFLGGSGAVLAVAVDYAGALFPGIVLVWLFNMLASLLRGSGDMKRPAFGLIVVVLVQICAASVLVFGAGPIASLGVRGGALALLAGFAAGSFYLALYLFRLRRPDWVIVLGPVDWHQLFEIGRRGLFASIQSVLTIAMAMIVTAFMAKVGPKALAGYGIGIRLELVLIPIIFSFGSACIAMAGANVGAGLRERALRISWTAGLFAALSVGAVGTVLAIFPVLWTGLFTSDREIAAVTGLYLNIVGPAYGFFGLGLCLYFASQAMHSLVWPVAGAGIRLMVLLIGGMFVLDPAGADAGTIFLLVAAAMSAYGIFNAAALRLGPWRR